MNEMVLPTALVLIIFAICLIFSQKNKNILWTLLYAVFGITGMYWFALMLYDEIIMPQEWWKEAAILPGILIILIIWAVLDDLGITPKPIKE